MTNPFGRGRSASDGNPFGRTREEGRPSALAAFASGAADTASFGFGDEIEGLLFGREARDAARQRQEQFRLYNPLAYGAGQIGGAFIGGGPLAAAGRAALGGRAAVQGLGWGGRALLGAGLGGVGLGAYQAGTVQSDDPAQRGIAAAQGFVPGAAFGGGLSLAGSALSPVVSRLWQGASPQRAAVDLLARGIEREGGTAPVAARLGEHAQMGRGGTLLDAMGESGEHLAMGAAARPSAGRAALRDMIEQRNLAMGPRAQQELSREFGAGDVADDLVHLEARRASEALPHYTAAYAQTVSAPGALRQMVRLDGSLAPEDQILTRAAVAARSAHIQRTGNFNVILGELEASPRYWHDMLEAAQDILGMQLRAARTGVMGGLSGSSAARATERIARFNRLVRGALGEDFRRAQDIYAGASRAMRARELGYEIVGPTFNSLRLGETLREVRRMSQGELEQLRMAAAAKLRDTIANADPRTGRADVLRTITKSEGQRQLFERIFGAGRLNDLMRRFEYDRRLFQTGVNTGIRTNSHTAPMLSAEAAQREATMTPATTPGGVFERLFGPELRRAADTRNEQVSTELLSMLATPADDAARMMGGQGLRRGLLSRAVTRADQLANARRRATINTIAWAPYSSIGGETLLNYAGAS